MVGNVKIARSERSYYCYIHIPTFHIVWLLRNFSLGGKLCLLDGKKYCVCISSPLQASLANVMLRARIGRKLFLIG